LPSDGNSRDGSTAAGAVQRGNHRLDLAVPTLDMERMLQRGLDPDALAVAVLKLDIQRVWRLAGEQFGHLAPNFAPGFLVDGRHLVADKEFGRYFFIPNDEL
jgi:hypothetical protein